MAFRANLAYDVYISPRVIARQVFEDSVCHEAVEQGVPNIGVGYLEAQFYLGMSFLIAWAR